jgi:hypothetical protein
LALQVGKKHGNPSVKVALRTSQADTLQYKNNEQYNAQKIKVNTEQYDITEQLRIQKNLRESSPL